MSLWTRLLKDILLAVLLGMLFSFAGAAWIDYDVPGAWPDLIGPSDHCDTQAGSWLSCIPPESLVKAAATGSLAVILMTGGETSMKPDALPLLLALIVLAARVVLWHRSLAKWVDGLLATGLLGTAGLLAVVVLG
jgi:hypothetical protein